MQQVDFDDTTTDLGIVAASIRASFDVAVTPNPATSELNVHIANEGKTDITIDVVDIVGKVIMSRNIELDGNDRVQFDINNLQSGVYLLNVSSEGKVLKNTRFLKN